MGNSQQPTSPHDSWLRRVAIVLSSLPASAAARLQENIDPEVQSRIDRIATSLTAVDATERDEVLREFRQRMFVAPPKAELPEAKVTAGEFQDEFEVSQINDSQPPGSSALLNSQVASVVSQWELPRSFPLHSDHQSVFAFLDDIDDETIVILLSHEHAQTIALVFASITPKQAARILPRLDPGLQSDIVRRIGRLEEIPKTAAAEIAAHLRDRATELEQEANNPGHQTLKAIIDAMPHGLDEPSQICGDDRDKVDLESGVAGSVLTLDETSSTKDFKADREMISVDDVHQHLIQLSPQSLCQALGRVQTREALLTLCGLPNEVAEQALSMLPRHKAREVRRGMANLTSIKIREIDDAKEIVALTSLELEVVQHQSARTPIAA